MPLRRSARLAAKAASKQPTPKPTKAAKQPLDEEKSRDRMTMTFIRSLLGQINSAKGEGNKVILTVTLFRFINDNAIQFVRRHGTFAATCTAKAIELMGNVASTYPNLCVQLVAFLKTMRISEKFLEQLGA